MKIGSLVNLSSYGTKCQFNRPVVAAATDNVGIVVNINHMDSYPYEVMWSCYLGPSYVSRRERHARRELKVARVK